MAIKLPQGFKISSRDAIDSRLVMTKADMLSAVESKMPSNYFCICKDDGKLYTYNTLNELDPETGKFRLLDVDTTELEAAIEALKQQVEDTENHFDFDSAEEDQVLVYNSTSGKWEASNLVDDKSIIYIDRENGLSLKGYTEASQGQILAKDAEQGLVWIHPLSDEQLQQKVNIANNAAQEAANSATAAGNSAVTAELAAKQAQRVVDVALSNINNKFWWGTLEEYNALEEILEGTFYFVQVSEVS